MLTTKRTWKRIGLGFVAIVTLVVGGLFAEWHYTHGQGLKRLHELEAKLDAEDPGWRWDEIVAEHHRKYPPDEQTAMILAARIKGDVTDLDRLSFLYPLPIKPESNSGNVYYTYWPDDNRITERQKVHDRLTTEYGTVNSIMRSIEGAPRLLFASDDILHTLLIDVEMIIHLSQLLSAEGISGIDNRKPDLTMRCVNHLLKLSLYAQQTPHVAFQGRCIGTLGTASDLIDRLLARYKEVDNLDEVIENIDKLRTRDNQSIVIRLERARLHDLFSRIDNGSIPALAMLDVELGEIREKSGLEHLGWRYLEKYYPESCTRNMERLTSVINDGPINNLKESAREDFDGPEMFSTIETFPLITTEVYLRWQNKFDAKCNCLQAALACEIYRQQYGTWPASLSDVVNEELIKKINDPYTREPLAYRIENDGIHISSVGKDLRDDYGPQELQWK